MPLSQDQIDDIISLLNAVGEDHTVLIAVMIDKEKKHKSSKVR